MNAQVQPVERPTITFSCSLTAAETILDGLAKLSIERAAGLYSSLREVIDTAVAKANAQKAPAPPAPPAEPPQPPQENTSP